MFEYCNLSVFLCDLLLPCWKLKRMREKAVSKWGWVAGTFFFQLIIYILARLIIISARPCFSPIFICLIKLLLINWTTRKSMEVKVLEELRTSIINTLMLSPKSMCSRSSVWFTRPVYRKTLPCHPLYSIFICTTPVYCITLRVDYVCKHRGVIMY